MKRVGKRSKRQDTLTLTLTPLVLARFPKHLLLPEVLVLAELKQSWMNIREYAGDTESQMPCNIADMR